MYVRYICIILTFISIVLAIFFSLHVRLSESLSPSLSLNMMCSSLYTEMYAMKAGVMRPTGGSGPVGLVKPSIGSPYEISLLCDVVVRYISTVYRHSRYLLGAWSQNLVSVPYSGHTGTRNESVRMTYRLGNTRTISLARLDGARRRPV